VGKVLKPFPRRTGGYLDVTLYDDSKKPYCRAVARIVALEHVINPDPVVKTQVNHRKSKNDNQAWNLEWASPSENAVHAHTNIIKAGIAVRRINPTTGEEKIYTSATEAALDVDKNQANITQCCKGTRPLCGGFKWEYVTDVPIQDDQPDERWVYLAASPFPELSCFPHYQVSNYGRVKGHHNRIIKLDTNQMFTLVNNTVRKTMMIYRVVLMAFGVLNPENKSDVDHIDGNYKNNRLENLRWATRLENNNNEMSRKKTSIRRTSTVTGETKDYIRVKDALDEGFTNSNIYDCINGKRSNYKGFTWTRL
jgi:hypothetical protein